MLLRTAYAQGIRYIDTAKAYRTEPDVAKFFKAVPEAKKDTFVVTKDTPKSPKDLIAKLDERLAALELDSVDMFFFHGLGDEHDTNTCLEFLKGKEFRETADAIRKSGKAKFFGFSCHNKDLAIMLETAAQANVVDAIMVKYSAFAAKDHPVNKALDACHAKNIGLISMKQLLGSTEMLGGMTGPPVSEAKRLEFVVDKMAALKGKDLKPYEMLLHAIWTDERISSSCVSLKNVDQITQNAHAARTFEPLKAAELDAIRELYLASNPTHCALCDGSCAKAAGTDAALGDLTRFLAYHEHSGERTEARRLYAEMADSARDWKGADLAAAQAACPNHLNFAELMPRVDEYLA
jgi:predicted aldo/keto reductase-like oxidoreductase